MVAHFLVLSLNTNVVVTSGRETHCREKDGWCEEGTIAKCRKLMLADLRRTMSRLEGQKHSALRDDTLLCSDNEEEDELDELLGNAADD